MTAPAPHTLCCADCRYYSLYDGNKREKLFEAYSEHVGFILSVVHTCSLYCCYLSKAVFSLSVTGALTRR